MCSPEGVIFTLLLQASSILSGSTSWCREMIYPESDQRLRAHKCLPHYSPAVGSGAKRCVLFLSMASGLFGNLTQMLCISESSAIKTSKHGILVRLKYTEWRSAKLYVCSPEDPRGVATETHG